MTRLEDDHHTYSEQIAHPVEPQPRYYLRAGDSEHMYVDLIERGAIDNGDGPEDMTLASFYDGDCQESKLADFVCDALNVGDTLSRHGGIPGTLTGLLTYGASAGEYGNPIGLVNLSIEQKQLGYCSYGMSQAEHEQQAVTQQVGLAGALFAFMGWLTTRDKESGPFSGFHEAGAAAQLIKQFCEMQGWPMPDEDWHHAIKPYSEPEEPSPYGNFPKTATGEGYLAKAMREEGEKLFKGFGHMETVYGGGRMAGKSQIQRASHEWLVTHGYLPVGSKPGSTPLLDEDDLPANAGVGFVEEIDDEDADDWEEEDSDEDMHEEVGEPPPYSPVDAKRSPIGRYGDGLAVPPFAVPVALSHRTCDHRFEIVPPDAFTMYRCDHCGLGYLEVKQPVSFLGFGEHPYPRHPSQKIGWTGTAQEHMELMCEDAGIGEAITPYIEPDEASLRAIREALRNRPASLSPTGPLPWDCDLRDDERGSKPPWDRYLTEEEKWKHFLTDEEKG